MRNLSKLFVLSVVLFPLIANVTWADTTGNSQDVMAARQEFESRCPKPEWWDRVSVSGATINTYDDLISYWQDKNRSKSQFFKAAYIAILDYPLDVDIVVNAIKLMNYTYSYPHRIELQEYAIEKYFSYKSPYGKPGNTIAGIVENLGRLYNDAGQYDRSVNLIERLLKERETEVNDHLLELIHLKYARALHGQGRTADAVNVLKKAVKKYNGSWEKRLNEAIARYGGSPVTTSVKPSAAKDPTRGKAPWWKNNIVIIGASLLTALLILVLRRASREQPNYSGVYGRSAFGADSDVEQLVRDGRQIEAIQLYRQIHEVGLSEAKQAVDQIAQKTSHPGT
ncbi:MAG: tetratricopeptide repeat protein [Proteobacteria bacterium]|nr:tetratricopeptide repeat protein [Pseudomonadota bacterium]